MAISPFGSERIAFEHPCVLVDHTFMLQLRDGKCNDRGADCTKRKWGLLGLNLPLLLILSACAPSPTAPVPSPMIAGGWQPAEPASKAVQDAANYAVTQLPEGHGALAEVRSAQTQVVAGTNYRMVLSLADGTIWEATVWHKLDGSYALSGMPPKP